MALTFFLLCWLFILGVICGGMSIWGFIGIIVVGLITGHSAYRYQNKGIDNYYD